MGLAIDTVHQKLYYGIAAANATNKVGELSTDGTAHRALITEPVHSRPRALVFDEDNRLSFIAAKHT